MINWNLFQTLYGTEKLQGCTNEDISYIEQMFGTLPAVLKDFYLTAARTEAFHQIQDLWMLPEHFRKWDWLRDSDYLILLDENQGVCQAGIRRSDLEQPDPPVYVSMDREEWELCAPTTSEFLQAALFYEAAFACEFAPEDFYFLTEEDFELLQSRLEQQPYELHNWIGDVGISIYSNAADNVAALMIVGEEYGERDIQMLYGASTKEGYEKIRAALEDVGEPA